MIPQREFTKRKPLVAHRSELNVHIYEGKKIVSLIGQNLMPLTDFNKCVKEKRIIVK